MQRPCEALTAHLERAPQENTQPGASRFPVVCAPRSTPTRADEAAAAGQSNTLDANLHGSLNA
jgi:hypothetical protein